MQLIQCPGQLDQNADAPPQATLIVDLDMSPVAGKTADPLSALWREARPGRWIIADPVLEAPDPSEARNRWREEVCAAGISLGLPYIPFEFGYSSSTHQFAGSLADVAARQQPHRVARRDAQFAAEGSGEMGLIGKAAFERQLGKRHGIVGEHLPRPLQPPLGLR